MVRPIPRLARILLVYVEPLLALNGAAMLLLDPASYLVAMTPAFDAPHPETSLSAAEAVAPVRVLTDQLSAMQAVFAFNLAFVLGGTTDRRTWRTVCAGMLLSDLWHAAASVRELAREGALSPAEWRAGEWFNFVILGVMGAVRLAVVLDRWK